MAITPRSTEKRSGATRAGVDDTIPAVERGSAPKTDSGVAKREEAPPIRPTIPIDRYRIGIELGRGGMGRVVEAFDVQLGRTVAVKEILPKAGSGTARRFAREIHITARLEHASIVPLYDSGISSDGKPFYVMRRVTGKPLDEMIARCRDLDERLMLLPRVLQAIDAVAHAHERGVIHRDLKPQNILLAEHGETVVIDWGLAKVLGEQDEDEPAEPSEDDAGDSLRTQIGSVFGTPGFMAPEQARGEVTDLQGDVYALGAVMYQLLAATPPVAGVSATEVMDKTRTHDIRPLSESAPGAPPELVAIATKALSFDPANRYPDAGALGEDVRRFTAGQLVAAHAYTNRQKLARFAKRHRGALSVAALATVACAVMAWIGVARILTERDAAHTARAEADQGKREAEDARDRLAERHDALIVLQANAKLESNPTEAIAILKQLSNTSPRAGDARAIAQAAAMRGVAWAIETSDEISTIVQLDGDARLLLEVTRDGMIRVFDLERRRLLASKAFTPYSRATWLAGGKLMVTHHAAPPQLFDPATQSVESLPAAIGPIATMFATRAGDRAILATPSKTAAIYDAASRTVTPIDFPDPIEQLDIDDAGRWYAVASHKLIVVYDRDGREITRRAGPLSRFVKSRFMRLAVIIDSEHLVECNLEPTPAWTEVAVASQAPHRVFDLAYRGRELTMYFTNGDVMAWSTTTSALYRKAHVERYQAAMVEGGDETLIIPSGDGKLHWVNDLARGALALPIVLEHMRLAARPGSPRVVALGDGVVTVFDLGVMPERFPVKHGTRAVFVDDDTLVYMPPVGDRWEWVDVNTRKSSPLDYRELMLPMLWDVDYASGRVLVREHSPKGIRFVVMRKNVEAVQVVVEGEAALARLVPGDALIYALGDGRLFAKVGNEPAKQVATLEGKISHATSLGHLTYAASSSSGEIVRGDLVTGKLERVRVPTGISGFLAHDTPGHVLIVEDNRLSVWDGPITEIAKFDKPITRVSALDGGIAIQVGTDAEIYVVEIPAGGRPSKPYRMIGSSATGGIVSDDGKLIGSLGNGQTVTLVELPSRARWTLPQLHASDKLLSIAPSSRRVLQNTASSLALWRLPHVASDFGGWLDRQTNAVVDSNSVLAWPWQQPKRP